MSLTPVNFITSASATATNGSDTITVTGNVDCSNIYKASAVFLGTRQVVQAISGTAPDGSGNSTIKLKVPWADPTTTAKLVVFNTFEDLSNAVTVMRNFIDGLGDIMAAGTGTAYYDGTGWVLRSFDPATLGTAATKDVISGPMDTTVDRVMTVGAGGVLGKAMPLPNGNVDDAVYGGKYFGYSGTHPSASSGDNPFTLEAGAFSLEVIGNFFNQAGEYITQVATTITPNVPRRKFRTKTTDVAGWSPWQEVFHTGNLNVNEFEAIGGGDVIGAAKCHVISATDVEVEIKLNAFAPPTGITQTGTFTLVDYSGSVVKSGVTFTVNAKSSPSTLVLNYSGITGGIAGTPLQVRGSSGSKITVNF